MKRGFTIIELIIFIAIFTLIIGSFITLFTATLTLQGNQASFSAVYEESQFLIQQIQYYVNNARAIDMTQDVATSTITFREAISSIDPIAITSASGVVYLDEATATPIALTSGDVYITNFSATRHFNLNSTGSAYGTDSVSYSFTASAQSTNQQAYSQSFQSSVGVLAPVPKITKIQQAKAESSLASVSSIAATYSSNNEAGDLLIAVVANATSSASVGVVDSNGNTWSMVASTSYPAYNSKLTVFAATNANAGANTVTAALVGGAGFASLFIYEYRGASTSTSFNASSTQIQTASSSPSSGFANATSSVELIFGVTHDGSTAEIPSPGDGFTFETSSTVTDVFSEDTVQYVTGPVAANWQYGGAPNSSSLVVTFR